ncbi:Uncharacterized protein APZ42_001777 [Daphnia magna]|uniref:Uncharacterized protein n=1 Tax=Daphnia magna TaxID=35525 RepID=A0A162C6S8_9CRUS|nr:Uncharacterized protein APZ42_001777 [Daphnia magna]
MNRFVLVVAFSSHITFPFLIYGSYGSMRRYPSMILSNIFSIKIFCGGEPVKVSIIIFDITCVVKPYL